MRAAIAAWDPVARMVEDMQEANRLNNLPTIHLGADLRSAPGVRTSREFAFSHNGEVILITPPCTLDVCLDPVEHRQADGHYRCGFMEEPVIIVDDEPPPLLTPVDQISASGLSA